MAKLTEKTLNRFRSLKEHYDDRYFTAQQAHDYLGLTKTHEIYDLLKSLTSHNMISKLQPEKKPAQYRVAVLVPKSSFSDAIKVSQELQEQAEAAVQLSKPMPTFRVQSELRFNPPVSALPQEKVAAAEQVVKKILTASSLPAILTIDGIKYVRMDRIAEVLLDQL